MRHRDHASIVVRGNVAERPQGNDDSATFVVAVLAARGASGEQPTTFVRVHARAHARQALGLRPGDRVVVHGKLLPSVQAPGHVAHADMLADEIGRSL